MKKNILFTADKGVSISFFKELQKLSDLQLLHLPLENYSYSINREEEGHLLENIEAFSFVVYGNLRNARYFMYWVSDNDFFDQIKDLVHLVPDQPTADFLEKQNIPAVMPREEARPIDIIEFLLRISREGTVLYPTTDQKGEEIPGLLQELDMPVAEFEVCREISLADEDLKEFREIVKKTDLDGVIFHSRSSVTRIQTAFPTIDFNTVNCISSGQAVSQKLHQSGIVPDEEANSTWRSLRDLLIQ